MSRANHSSESDERPVPTRDQVVADIVRIANDLTHHDEARELSRLVQAIKNCKGRFGLFFAVCSDNAKRENLIGQLNERLKVMGILEVRLSGDESSLIDSLVVSPTVTSELLIVSGVESLLPSTEDLKIRRVQTLQELQHRRERLREVRCPLVMCMPEYVYTMLGQEAVDFWSWQSGSFFFIRNEGDRTGQTAEGVAHESAERSSQPNDFTTGRVSVDRLQYMGPASRLPSRIPFGADTGEAFIGREREVASLVESLRHGHSVALQGAGGVGKTSLAIAAAQRLRSEFPEQVFVPVGLHRPSADRVERALREVIDQLVPERQSPPDVATMTAFYRSLLSNRRSLIILDDVPADMDLTAFLPPSGSALVATTRTHVRVPGFTEMSLDRLESGEAVDFLRRLVPALPIADAQRICSLYDNHPLLLRLVARLLATGSMSLEQLLANGSPDTVRPPQVLATLLESAINRLEDDNVAILSRMSVFPGTFDAEAESVVCNDRDQKGLRDLVEAALVFGPDTLRRYRLHELIRAYAEHRVQGPDRALVKRLHANHYLVIAENAQLMCKDDRDNTGVGLQLFATEWENVSAGYRWSVENEDADAAAICSRYADACADYLQLRFSLEDCVDWFMSAWRAASQIGDDAAAARHLGRLGNAFAGQGATERSLEIYLQQIRLIPGQGDHESRAWALGNLGSAFQALGRHVEALQCFEEQMAIGSRLASQSLVAAAQGNLGTVHYSMGRLKEALNYYREQLRIVEEVGDTRGHLQVLNNLGLVYARLGNVDQASALCERQLGLAEKLGDKRAATAALDNLGTLLSMVGRSREAIPLYEQALRIAKTIGDNRAQAAVLTALGHLREEGGDVKRAEDLFRQALAIAEESVDLLASATLRLRLINATLKRGDIRKAVMLCVEAARLAHEVGDVNIEGVALLYELQLLVDPNPSTVEALTRTLEEISKRVEPDLGARIRREIQIRRRVGGQVPRPQVGASELGRPDNVLLGDGSTIVVTSTLGKRSPSELVSASLTDRGKEIFEDICSGLSAYEADRANQIRFRLAEIIHFVAMTGHISQRDCVNMLDVSVATAASDLKRLAGGTGKSPLLKNISEGWWRRRTRNYLPIESMFRNPPSTTGGL